MADRDHADHQQVERETPTTLEPVRRTMTVGAADDVAERDADRRADEALGWLAGQQPMDRQAEEPHVHTAACGIARSHAPAAAESATIGYEGGDLDAGTQGEIEGAVGGGESLDSPVRSTMEAAFGADLGKVRIHRGAQADRISRKISAEAFTTGKDIFFSAGAYDPSSARGQRVLAHELGHVMQGVKLSGASPVHRTLSEAVASVKGLFSSKTPEQKAEQKKKDEAEKAEKARKSEADKKAKEEKKAREAEEAAKKKAEETRLKEEKKAKEAADKKAANDRKKAVKGKRAENAAANTAAMATAKQVNSNFDAFEKSVKLSYEAEDASKLMTPVELAAVQQEFAKTLRLETEARERIYQLNTGDMPDDVEQLAFEAGKKVWDDAHPTIRSMRPQRFDDFDIALKEVEELAREGRAQMQGQVGLILQDNAAGDDAPIDPGKALAMVKEERELGRREERIKASSKDRAGLEASVAAQATTLGDKAKAEAEGKGQVVGAEQEKALRDQATEKARKGAYGVPLADEQEKVEKVKGVATKGVKGASKGAPALLEKTGKLTAEESGLVGEMIGASEKGVESLFDMIKDVMGLVSQIKDIRSGAADRGAKLTATRQGVKVLSGAADGTAKTLKEIKDVLEEADLLGSVAGQNVSAALPIVGLITSSLGLIDSALKSIPLFERHFQGVEAVEEALLKNAAPLAASYDRINSRTAQLIEKTVFDLAKHVTMLGLNIAEVATAGGFAVPAAAKLTVSIVDTLHSVGHTIYDTVMEDKAGKATKAFGVKHEEGASRNVLKYDVSSSVGVLIVAAKKHKHDFARVTLLGYGVTEQEIDTMWFDELQDKVLEALESVKNPKEVKDKISDAITSVKDTVGLGDKPPGTPEDERSLLEKIKAAVADKKKAFEDNWTDAKAMTAAKNETGHGGKKDRGTASALFYAIRGSEKNEESLAKVRKEQADRGVAAGSRIRSSGDLKARAEKEALMTKGPDAKIGAPVLLEQEWIKKITSKTNQELFEYAGQLKGDELTDPLLKAKFAFIEGEVANRIDRADPQKKKVKA